MNEQEKLEYKRMKNREYQSRWYKKNRLKVINNQRRKRKEIRQQKMLDGTLHDNENLRGNILSKIYVHPKNTYSRTTLQRMKKGELIELLNKLNGDK